MVAPWAGLPLGIVADILTGQPVGVSATVWPLALLALAIIEPRFPLRDQRMDWALAAAAIILGKLIAYKLLALVNLPLPFAPVLTGMICTVLFFPILARLAAWTERQWLAVDCHRRHRRRSDEHTPELQSLLRITYPVLC